MPERFDKKFPIINIGRDIKFNEINGKVKVLDFIQSEIDLAVAKREKEIVERIDKVLVIEINPSNDDQRSWYRGLGREEAQREVREKVINLITTK